MLFPFSWCCRWNDSLTSPTLLLLSPKWGTSEPWCSCSSCTPPLLSLTCLWVWDLPFLVIPRNWIFVFSALFRLSFGPRSVPLGFLWAWLVCPPLLLMGDLRRRFVRTGPNTGFQLYTRDLISFRSLYSVCGVYHWFMGRNSKVKSVQSTIPVRMPLLWPFWLALLTVSMQSSTLVARLILLALSISSAPFPSL